MTSSLETFATDSTAFLASLSLSLALNVALLIGGIFIADKILFRCVSPTPAGRLANVALVLMSYAFGPGLPD